MDDSFLIQVIRSHPKVIPFLTGRAAELVHKKSSSAKQFASYGMLRDEYWAQVYDFVDVYLGKTSDNPNPEQGQMQDLINVVFQEAMEMGYQDSGGTLPLDDDTQSYVDDQISSERGHVSGMFESLRNNNIDNFAAEAISRADGYAQTLDGVYSYGKLVGAGNKMLTCVGDDGKESCEDCQRVKDQRHRASWWIENGYPPSRDFICGGYNCDHHLEDDDGNVWTQ